MTAPAETERADAIPRDVRVGAAILLFCALAYWITLGFKEAPAALAQNVQPATFPRLVLGVIAVLTLAMMALGMRGAGDAKPMPPLPVWLTGATMIGFVLAFQAFGILAAMALFAFVGPLLWGARNLLAVAGFAVLFPAAVYVVFVRGLGVWFEPGIVETVLGL